MKYLLDTNICIHYLNGNAAIDQRVLNAGVESLAITYGVLAELFFGAYNSSRVVENVSRVDELARQVAVLHETRDTARQFGSIKAALKSRGKLIEDFDILAASIALANGLTMVTDNVRHLGRIDGLSVENWLR